MTTANPESSETSVVTLGEPKPEEPQAGSSEENEIEAHPVIELKGARFALVFVGLALAIFLAALDQTIVSTAIPKIAAEFSDFQRIPWIGTAFLLTTAAFSPTYGKLSDIFGRRSTFLFAVITFEVGSAICGAAATLDMLIVGRAIAGVGGGGIFNLVLIIISDLVEFRDRGKYQGMIGAVFGLASVIGPLLGGLFTDHLTWRWCFYINLPVGLITVIAALLFLNFPHTKGSITEKLKRIDYLGSIVLMGAIVCILLPLQSGGNVWNWNDPQTIALFIVGGVLAIAFVVIEVKFAVEPVVPPKVFVNRSIILIYGLAAFFGASFISLVFYLPTFFQVALGKSATDSGIAMFPLVIGVVVCSIGSGLLVSKTGYYTYFFYIGFILMGVGTYLCSLLDINSSNGALIGFLLITGMGVGSVVQIRVLAAQASVNKSLIAIATSLVNFCQTLGGCFGLAITGAIFNNQITSQLQGTNLPPQLVTAIEASPQAIVALQSSPALHTIAVNAFVGAFSLTLKYVIPFIGVALLLSLGVKQYHHPKKDATKEPEAVVTTNEPAKPSLAV
ncbi:major facilitator superfamily domain-containing protein [Polychytrium aggregatum]|uniref:major facilitator superfamily domain-containing protein n=1 Tax=Polychytrium aggregatum TaxID=110093 RepID=UPI0022FE78B9|nr:major facilitator superfamily domain-containing protein [Polychytrium aggregatum]XP_052970364.1 major facilitator superfamily domain-containing protein [Polychytrium aggregatum]KAI9190721.1 major facilitator superfamily domain-containing protein [Polychytrium aggregatum]KAI9208284.1 major facilitator superfamily domain-containing protein [Polychytrium aggregatum]